VGTWGAGAVVARRRGQLHRAAFPPGAAVHEVTISGRLVHHGPELTSLVEARSAAEDIADSCQQGTP